MKCEIITNLIDKIELKEANEITSKNVIISLFAAKIIVFWKPKTYCRLLQNPFLVIKACF